MTRKEKYKHLVESVEEFKNYVRDLEADNDYLVQKNNELICKVKELEIDNSILEIKLGFLKNG